MPNLTQRSKIVVLNLGLVLLVACGDSKRPVVQDLTTQENLASVTLHSLAGMRDGDRLQVRALFSDSSSMLTVEMHFAVGSPTTLESGIWRWARGARMQNGAVKSRSVTFLGGQDGPPSIGGTFDLLDPNGSALYRIHIPVTQLLRQRASAIAPSTPALPPSKGGTISGTCA